VPIGARRVLADNLSHAPSWYLRWLAAGSIATALGSVGAMVSLLLVAGDQGLRRAVPVVCLIAWAAGVWIVTRPHESSLDLRTDFKREGRWSRWASRLTQWGWAAGVALAWASAEVETRALMAGTPVNEELVRGLMIAAWVCLSIGLLGLVPVCAQLAALSEWAGAEWTGEWMRGASIAMLLALPMLGVSIVMGTGSFVTVVVGVFGAILGLGSALVLAVGVVQVAVMSLWALKVARAAIARDIRVADRAARDVKRFAKRAEAIGTVNPLDAGARIQAPRAQGPRTQAEADLSPIALEPERQVGKKTIRYERPGEGAES
jgi:hypothetical protein